MEPWFAKFESKDNLLKNGHGCSVSSLPNSQELMATVNSEMITLTLTSITRPLCRAVSQQLFALKEARG